MKDGYPLHPNPFDPNPPLAPRIGPAIPEVAEVHRSTLALTIERLQDLDGRLSALTNTLAILEEDLNGSSTGQAPDPTADASVPPPSGKIGQLCRTTDSLTDRLSLLNGIVERLVRTLE